MTVIVLDTDDESVVLAADSQWTEDTDVVFYRSKVSPIYQKGTQIGAMATSGDARHGLVFEAAIAAVFSQTVKHKDVMSRIQSVADAHKKRMPGGAVVVVHGLGFSVDEEGLVLPKKRWAIGSGGMIALGAMWGRQGSSLRLATLGCKAAIALTAGCGGNIDTFVMPSVLDTHT